MEEEVGTIGSSITKFKLPQKKVTVRFIKRNKGMAAGSWVTDDHAISGGMLNKAFKRISVPMLKSGSLKNVLTNEEKEFLESPEGLNTNLSIYSNRKFWAEKMVSLFKTDLELDLSDPIDYIDYKILLSNSDTIAPSLKEVNNKLTYQFVLIEEGEENDISRDSFNYKKKAFKLYSAVELNENILRGILQIINKRPISKESKLRFLQDEVEKIIEKNPKSFVNLLEDSNYEYKILLSEAENLGIVISRNKQYSTSDGIELCEEGEIASYDNAVRYLSQPKNQELVDILKVKIESYK